MGEQMSGTCDEIPDDEERLGCRRLMGDHFDSVFANFVHQPTMQPASLCTTLGYC